MNEDEEAMYQGISLEAANSKEFEFVMHPRLIEKFAAVVENASMLPRIFSLRKIPFAQKNSPSGKSALMSLLPTFIVNLK